MQFDPTASTSSEPAKGLPPVAPPSGRFIVQLFLVPGLIVAVAVLVILGFKYLVGGSKTPDDFLKNLDSSNPDVRWRAASDLSQVLSRPESLALASDPKFGLDLADRLHNALEDLRKDEEETIKKNRQESKKKQQAAWQTLAPKRNYALYLCACLGNLTVPVGVDLLCQVARDAKGSDEKSVALRRRRAIWALANQGENLKRLKQLDRAEKDAVIDQLKKESAGRGLRAVWATTAIEYIRDNKPLRVDETLADCARDRDPFLRALVAFTLKYWDGKLVEPTLVRLARDRGEGNSVEVGEMD